jgi:hypothetical protein
MYATNSSCLIRSYWIIAAAAVIGLVCTNVVYSLLIHPYVEDDLLTPGMMTPLAPNVSSTGKTFKCPLEPCGEAPTISGEEQNEKKEKSVSKNQDEEQERRKKDDRFPVDKNEFPYRLTCLDNKLEVPKGKYSVAMAYHIGMVKNWKSIVFDQLRTLHSCGLDKMASHTILSYSNGNLGDLLQTLNEPETKFATPNEIVHSVEVPWEGAALNAVYGFCQRQVAEKKEKTVVFYFHNKGASKYGPKWKESLKRKAIWKYGNSLYWRKYMEYFLLEQPGVCIDKIVNHGAKTCSVLWSEDPSPHYSGNFWAASCDHLITNGPVPVPGKYTRGERWIGLRIKYPIDHQYYPNLHNNSIPSLYKHAIMPEEYRNVSAAGR